MKLNFTQLLFLLLSFVSFAQKSEYTAATIDPALLENANAVVRFNQIDIVISSQRNMNVKEKRVVTVLNAKGLSSVDALEYYDKRRSVQSIQAIVLDAFGNEIKKVKRKDFKDHSVTGGGTLFSESRIVYLDYTPIQYPFTIVFESEVESSNTAFIPSWFPLDDYLLSVQKSIVNVSFPNNLGFKKKESNFAGFEVQRTIQTDTQLSYQIENVVAQKREDYSPAFNFIYPNVKMGLEVFHIEGVDGTAKTWQEFGKWYSDAILTGTTVLPDETVVKIKQLVGNEKDLVKKAKIVYDYVQQKSRYVSIQVGIGGWKPMYATDVDRLGYGDCKALSNYTKALLSVVDVPSYNTLLYGDKDKIDIDDDFVSMQGNHMILCVPNKDENIFLECTSQVAPFGYQANFTDDRKVLIIKPEGGEIVRTKNYQNKENAQISIGEYSIDEVGDFSGKITMVSKGSQYEKSRTESMLPEEQESYFKNYWSNIKNLKINSTKFENDKDKVTYTIESNVSASNFGNLTGNKMMFALNAFNQNLWSVTRFRNRKKPFEIDRGFFDSDSIEITLPSTFTIEFLPTTLEVAGAFGDYKAEFIKKDANHITYKRSFLLKKGNYPKEQYEEYRLFIDQISRNDNAKIILSKNL